MREDQTSDLTDDERRVYQSLVSRGVDPKDALTDALDGVTLDTAREVRRP